MFVKKGMGKDKSKTHEEQIITRAMGVRRPPNASETVEAAHPNEKDESSISIKNQPEGNGFDGKPAGKTLESIKITAPGTYELNLPSLFERDELIMAVKEGTYFIDLTSAFKKVKRD